jgi:hypothetical protein
MEETLSITKTSRRPSRESIVFGNKEEKSVATNDNRFPHLTFQIAHAGRARLHGGTESGQRTQENKQNRAQHAARLHDAAQQLSARWCTIEQERVTHGLPNLPAGHPLLLLVEEDVDVEFLRSAFGFEIIAEEDGGFIIVATQDIDFRRLNEILKKFLEKPRGGGSAAKVYELLDVESSDQRLARILSETLLRDWPLIADETTLIVDISISCVGNETIADFPPQRADEEEAAFAARTKRYLERHSQVVAELDEIQRRRETEFGQFIGAYRGSVFSMSQDPEQSVFHLPDSFTVRAQVSGKCFKDLAQNHPHVFQIAEVEAIEQIGVETIPGGLQAVPELMHPRDDAPSVCVIDSGMEEEHLYLRPAIITTESRCFIPGVSLTDVADYVKPHGHGTRIAGAVLYPASFPVVAQRVELPCWLHNARVLDGNCKISDQMMPAIYMERVVEHYSDRSRTRPARIFNHSINSQVPSRRVHMSTWGAAIDKLCCEHDILIIQSAGNITCSEIASHLVTGLGYPQYQLESSSRVRNPGQSLAALTVGSVAHTFWQQDQRSSVAQANHPSAFSPAGAGIWGSIKPDVVEYGGDFVADNGPPPIVFPESAVALELVRSTMHSPGATSKDEVGTSFAAPKVSHIAAMLARQLPDEPCLLYRALIANSARWPEWAEAEVDKLSVLRRIGYGIPNVNRATRNTEYRVTLVSSGEQRIPAREAHVYHIPVPEELRKPERDHLIRIDVSLAYASMPRRTRRRIRGYLATVLDWDVSKQGESIASFRNRIFRGGDPEAQDGELIFKWMLRDRSDLGEIRGLSRQNSTLQKDWCFIRSHELPPDFCIAVVGHPGWDPSPETKAKYAIAVSFEAVNEDLRLYQPIRVAVEARVPVEVQQRIEVPANPYEE